MLELMAFSAIDKLRDTNDYESVKSVFKESVNDLGVSAFIICDVPPDAPPGAQEIYASGWDKEWEERYLSKNYSKYDPVPNSVNWKADPYYWEEVELSCKKDSTAITIMNEARSEFGMHAGYCVPIHGLRGISGLVSVATSDRDWMLSEREEAVLHVISLYAYEAVRRIRDKTSPGGGGLKLAPREIECIKWVAAGKTSWEIGMILGISAETVSDYLKSASKRLGTSSRAHLVAKSHRLKMIW
jgi:LuxR family transcriptional regulator, quorum-sensing system regulator BjaR1